MALRLLLRVNGEGGIRTHVRIFSETAFRERHHEPLGHLSKLTVNNITCIRQPQGAKAFTDLIALFGWVTINHYGKGDAMLTVFKRMIRASRLDGKVFGEIAGDTRAGRQVWFVLGLAALSTWFGIGMAGFFKMAGMTAPLFLLVGFLIFTGLLVVWSVCILAIRRLIFRGGRNGVSTRQLLRIFGFCMSPWILGLLVATPRAGLPIFVILIVWNLLALIVAVRHIFQFSRWKATATAVGSGAAVFIVLLASVVLWIAWGSWFGGITPFAGAFDRSLNKIVQPHRFSIGAWELVNAPKKIFSLWGSVNSGDAGTVENYFTDNSRAQTNINDVEKIIENQIKQKLEQENLTGFPPVNLRLSALPHLLVISPKDRIETYREIFLDPRLTLPQMEDIEKQADALGVSSLVVDIGGFGGAYPSMVSNNSSLAFTIDASVEEWLHQYLALRPLGFRYVLDLLGVQRDYQVATINEAVAGMVSEELGAAITEQYYAGLKPAVAVDYSGFYKQMREIRLTVDDYLAKGQADAAEQYMEQKRQDLAKQGYYIRKLNQAYFAWHGTYADQPDSVSPVGAQLRALRAECDSVRQFLDIVSQFTSEQELTARLAK
jgi:hypothetical protein